MRNDSFPTITPSSTVTSPTAQALSGPKSAVSKSIATNLIFERKLQLKSAPFLLVHHLPGSVRTLLEDEVECFSPLDRGHTRVLTCADDCDACLSFLCILPEFLPDFLHFHPYPHAVGNPEVSQVLQHDARRAVGEGNRTDADDLHQLA